MATTYSDTYTYLYAVTVTGASYSVDANNVADTNVTLTASSQEPLDGSTVALSFLSGLGISWTLNGTAVTVGGSEGILVTGTTGTYFLTDQAVQNDPVLDALFQLPAVPVSLATTSEPGFEIYGLSVTGNDNLDLVNTSGNGPTTGATVTVQGSGGLAPGDTFTVTSVPNTLAGSYTYEGTATVDGATGFIGVNAAKQEFFFTTYSGAPLAGGGQVTGSNTGESSICFMPGTLIRTATGEVAVELVKVGDIVETSDSRHVTVRWIGIQSVSRRFRDELQLPVRIKSGALADDVPCRDLLVSPDHALFVDGLLIQAGALVNGTSVVRDRNVPMTFKYYHIEVDDHSLILAENTPAETFVDNVDRLGFDNWAEYEALYPEGKAIVEMPYPRAKAARQVPQAIRARLSQRSVEMFGKSTASAA
jgi:hypothetical protein